MPPLGKVGVNSFAIMKAYADVLIFGAALVIDFELSRAPYLGGTCACLCNVDACFKSAVVQPKWLTEPKYMSLSYPGPHIECHIDEGRTLNGLPCP